MTSSHKEQKSFLNIKYFMRLPLMICLRRDPPLSVQTPRGSLLPVTPRTQTKKPEPSPDSRGMKSKRRKNLISTEFSPSEWNINNLNKYKK